MPKKVEKSPKPKPAKDVSKSKADTSLKHSQDGKPSIKVSPKKKKSQAKKIEYYYGRGRRRTATARVRVYLKHEKKGEIEINKKLIEQYFPGEISKTKYLEPLRVSNLIGKYYISARISGSGKHSQIDAFIHGLARALVLMDKESFHSVLKKRGFLTRDSRKRERRKVGTGGKARRQKQSPKR